jgi:hypothetical protein
MRFKLVWAALLFALGTAPAAQAACTASLSPSLAMPVVQYDPFVDGTTTQTFDVAVAVVGMGAGGDCQLGLSIAEAVPATTRSARLGGASVTYRLLLAGDELRNDPEAVHPLAVSGTGVAHFAVRIEVGANQIAPAGLYVDNLSLRLVDLGQNRVLGSPMLASLAINMASRAQINLAGGAIGSASSLSSAVMDFGALQTNAIRTALLQLRSTAPVRISVFSQNGGALLRIGGDPADALAYALTLDGEAVNLAGRGGSITRNAAATPAGQTYALGLRITGNPAVLPAGDYHDVLTVNVNPL